MFMFAAQAGLGVACRIRKWIAKILGEDAWWTASRTRLVDYILRNDACAEEWCCCCENTLGCGNGNDICYHLGGSDAIDARTI